MRTHRGPPALEAQVLQEALGVVDGGVELGTGCLPAAVQVLPKQRAPMAAEWKRHMYGEGAGSTREEH